MARVSLSEQYDDKDVIKQIYLLWDAIDQGAVKDLDIVREGGQVKITVTFHDDEVKEFTLEDDEIQNVIQSQSGSQVTITIVMKSGTTYPFTFTAATGVTLDTDQTVTGMKVFSAASTNFSHDVDVGADLNVGGTVEASELTVDTDAVVDGNLAVGGNASITGHVTGNVTIEGDLDVGNLAVEASGQKTMLSNANGIETAADTPVTFRRLPKMGSGSLGSNSEPIYLQNGVPTACGSVMDTVTAQVISRNAIKTIKTGGSAGGRIIFQQEEGTNANLGMFDVKDSSGNTKARIYAQSYDGSTSRLRFLVDKGDGNLGELIFDSPTVRGSAVLRLSDSIPSDALSNTLITKAYVSTTDGSNNILHTIGTENVDGDKTNTAKWNRKSTTHTLGETPSAYWEGLMNDLLDSNGDYFARTNLVSLDTNGTAAITFARIRNKDVDGNIITTELRLAISKAGVVKLTVVDAQGNFHHIAQYGGA